MSEAFERVLDRALSADVESRYPSAAEFLQAVNRAADDEAPGAGGGLGPGGGAVAPGLTS